MSLEKTPSRIFNTQIKTLYLHGFLSSGASQKGQWLHKANRQHSARPLGELSCPTYRQKNLLLGISTIEQQLQQWQSGNQSTTAINKMVIIGSSLGGYLAQYFANQFDCAYIMINPTLNPIALFEDYLGQHTNPYTGEQVEINQDYCSQLAKLEVETPNADLASLLLVDEGDEVVDIPYACQKYHNVSLSNTVVYSGGNHAFQHMSEAWWEIQTFIKHL